jgi:DNA-binding transcriptional ArsR family regulator
MPAPVAAPGLQQRAADLLEWVWPHTVVPYWPRRRRIIEADIVARRTKLGQGGWAAALADMRQGLRWLGEGRLQINAYGNPTTTQLVTLTGQGLGSVGRHLKILWDAGLLHRRRAGRSVLYYRSEAGGLLVSIQNDGTHP